MRRAVLPLLVLALLVVASTVSFGPAHAQEHEEDRLEVALVVRIELEPLLMPSGDPRPDARRQLAELAGVLEELTTLTHGDEPTAMSLAVSPVLVEELGSFNVPDAARTHAALLVLASRLPILAAPYADVRLPHLPSTEEVREQFDQGARALSEHLEVEPRSIAFPPGLALSTEVLEALPHPAALADAGRLDARPVLRSGVRLLPATAPPAGDDPVGILGRLYPAADHLAMVLEPDAATPDLVRSLAGDERVRIVDLAHLEIAEAVERVVTFEDVPEVPGSYRQMFARAKNAVADFASYTSADNSILASMHIKLGRAASTVVFEDDWSPGIAWAEAILDRLRAERGLVRAEDGSVTFTARSGRIPVTVINLATYPVSLRVTVSSPKLDFPDGASREVVVPPRGDTITFLAEARSTGTFPVMVHLSSPDGRVRFGSGEVNVRSAAANLSALVLTAGAALFLAGWFGHRIIGRRRGRA